MNILVIGGGVLGSVYAAKLAQSGQKVTVMARGQRLAELRERGLIIENQTTGVSDQVPVDLIEELAPEDVYDLVLVLVRKNQVAGLLPCLAANRGTPRILFMHNNAAGPFEMIQALGRERVILGFPGAGGTRENGIVRYLPSGGRFQKTTIGEYTGILSPRIFQIAAVFENAGLPTRVTRHMDAWLKTHVALVSPIANAIYMAGGSNYRLAKTPDGLILLVRAVREGFAVLTAMGLPVTPWTYHLLFSLPEPILVKALSNIMSKPAAELVMAKHANVARDEMSLLHREFLQLARTTSVQTPAIQKLGEYMDEIQQPVLEGNASLKMRWDEVGFLAAGALMATGFFYLLKRIRRS